MSQNQIKCDGGNNSTADRAVLMKFSVLLLVGVIVVYAKLLWPLVFGRMHNEGISFIAAVQDISLHAAVFVALIVCWLAAASWVYIKGRLGG